MIYKNVLGFFLDTISIKDCTSELAVGEQWKCLAPETYYKHVYTPAFFIQSLHDTWFLSHALGVQCSVSKCSPTDRETVKKSKDLLLSHLYQVMSSSGDGLFAHSCPFHSVLLKSMFYENLYVNNTSVASAVGQWYFHRKSKVFYVYNESISDLKRNCDSIH